MNFCSKNYYIYFYLRQDFTPYYIGKGSNRRAWVKGNVEIDKPKDKSKIIIVEQNLTEIQAFILERYYIRWFGRKDLETGILRNKSDGGYGGPSSLEGRVKLSNNKKEWWTEGRRKEQSEKIKNSINPFHSYSRTEESTKARSLSQKEWWTEERRKKKSDQMLGTIRSDISQRTIGENNPMFNKKHSRKTKELQREKALLREKIKCEHCGKEFCPGMYKRWHGEKCKRLL